MDAALRERLEAAGIVQPLLERLSDYGTRVLEANRSFNLTGAKTGEEVAEHLIDSATVLPYVGEDLVDVGSGAGFPAMVVALATGTPVTLIESARKKAAFLQRTLAAFELVGTVVADRAEVAARRDDLRERFGSGTARAVSSAPTVAELLLPFVRIGGVAILQRGGMDARERIALQDAALVLGAEVEDEISLGVERRIVLLRKTAPTPLRFPRRTGIPEKRPLCS
ncbi:MAG TPA: 16S rRNA (guanine(527)-N(7))-methyltransferase RsmG [Candidatus Tumulicola sp.]|nr:16S rRNA (guanine(527)-N(7))-methyltransferase RsmG [Candidatus Tumulicola sp.]